MAELISSREKVTDGVVNAGDFEEFRLVWVTNTEERLIEDQFKSDIYTGGCCGTIYAPNADDATSGKEL